MNSGGTLEMEGGTLDTRSSLYISSGATATLDGVTVKDYIYNYGTLNLADVTTTSYIEGNGSITASNSTIGGSLEVTGKSLLENVTCTRLNVDSDSDVTTQGQGVTMTGEMAFLLTNFSGSVGTLLNSIDWTATAENAYVGVANLNNATLTALPETLPGGYKSYSSVFINSGKTVTLEEGVCLQMQNRHYLYVDGLLVAENEAVADAITGTTSSEELYIRNGGKLQLKNANVTGIEDIFMNSGGTLEMKGGTLDTRSYLQIREGATATLDGVTVKDYIYNYGTLSLSNSTVNNSVYVYSGSTANITGCAINGTLEISMGSTSTTITGNDFSKTTLKLTNMASSTGVIDLSGNYWGTTDIESVIAKIQGYTEDRVLISGILMAPPTQEFSFDATMAGNHRLSHLTTSLTLNFNRLVDADTVNAASILLTDAEGNKIAIQKYEVSGKKVTLYFDELPTGDYRVNCTEELKDVDGKSFTASENFSSGITYHCLQIAQPRVLLFRSNSTVTDVFSYVDVFFDQVMDDSTISLDSVHLYAPDGQEIELTQMRKAGVAGNIFYRFYFDTVSSKGTYTLSVDQSVCNDWGFAMTTDYVREIYVSSPDLTVGTELDVSSTTLGRYTTITYTVSNIGDAMTPGTWTDAVYLCRTQQWNEDEAILLGRYNRTEALSENGSYTASVKGLLADLEPGDYYIFVRTDESDRLSEDKENNNVSAVGTKISIGVPEFTGESVAGRLSSANETLYYAFTPTESGSYNLTVDNPNAMVMVTTVVNGKAINKKTTANSLHFSVFNAEAGTTYYIAIKGGKDTSYKAQIQKSEFAVYDSSFSNLAAGHPSTLTLVGSEFAEGMSVYVVDEYGVRYDAERVVIVDSCQATVTFSLPEALAAGTELTLYVQNEADTVVKLEESLHIATFSDLVELEFTNMNGERHVGRVGWVWKADLYAENKAGYDVSNAIILITDTAEDFAMYYGYDDAKVRDRSALLFLGGADALTPEVMTAGESSKLGIYIKNYRSGVGAIQAWLLDPNSKEEITAAQWAYFESALRPTACSDAEWSAWWSDMKPRIGNTIGDFTTFIYGMRDAVAAAGQKVNVSSLADLTSITMTHCPDYVPGLKISGCVISSNESFAPCQYVYVYQYIDGERVYLYSSLTDEDGEFSFYGINKKSLYELEFSQPVEYEGMCVKTIQIDTNKDDAYVEVKAVSSESKMEDEYAIRLASNQEGNYIRIVWRDSNLYACNVESIGEEVQVLTENSEIVDYAVIWSDYHQMYVLAYVYREENEDKNAIILLKPNGETYDVSKPIDLPAGTIEDIYVTETGEIVHVSSSAGSISEETVELTFSSVALADDEDMFVISTKETEDDIYLFGKTYLKNHSVGIGGELKLPGNQKNSIGLEIKEQIWSENDNVQGKSTIVGKFAFNWDKKFDVKKFDAKKIKPKNEIKLFANLSLEKEVRAWYDCDAGKVKSSVVSRSVSASVGVRHDFGATQLLGPAGTLLQKLMHHASRWNINVFAGYIVQAEGTFKWTSDGCLSSRLDLKDSGVYIGAGVSLGVGAKDENDVSSSSRVELGASITGTLSVNGYSEWEHMLSSHSSTSSDMDWNGKIELSFGVNVQFSKRWKGSATVTISFSKTNGFDYDLSFELGYEREHSLTSGMPYVYQKQVDKVTSFQFSDVQCGDYAGDEHLSAYAYMTKDGAVTIEYFNAQTQEATGTIVNVAVDDERSLFYGFSNIQHLDAETDGEGRVYLSASGFLTVMDESVNYVQGVAQTGITDAFAMFGASQLETLVVDQNGAYSLLDQTNLEKYYWNGGLINTTKDARELDTYYLNGELGIIWVASSEPGVNQVYTSVLRNDVWETPTLLYSSVNELGSCYIEEVEGEFYVNFSELRNNAVSDETEVLTYVFTWDNENWFFDESCNTVQGKAAYDTYEENCGIPEITLSTPQMTKNESGKVLLSLQWESTHACTYVVIIDGVEYDVKDATSYEAEVLSGNHVVSVRATSLAGMSVTSSEKIVSVDCSAPVLLSMQCYYFVNERGENIVRWAWNCAEFTAGTILIVDDKPYHLDKGQTSYEMALGAGQHQYKLLLMDAVGNVSTTEEKIEIQSAVNGPELVTPKCEISATGETTVTFSWKGVPGYEYCLIVDGVAYQVGTAETYVLTLPDGAHKYSVVGSSSSGLTVASFGCLETKASAQNLKLNVLSTEVAENGKVLTRLVWNNEDLIEATLSDGVSRYDVSSGNLYTILTNDGYVNLTLEGRDAFGNEMQESVSFRFDASAPIVTLNQPVCNETNNGVCYAYFSWECEDFSSCEYELYVNDKLMYRGVEKAYALELIETVSHWKVVATDVHGYSSVVSSECSLIPIPELVVEESIIENAGAAESAVYALTWQALDGAVYNVCIGGQDYWVGADTRFSIDLPSGLYDYSVTAFLPEGKTSELCGTIGNGERLSVKKSTSETSGWFSDADIEIDSVNVSKLSLNSSQLHIFFEVDKDAPKYDFYLVSVDDVQKRVYSVLTNHEGKKTGVATYSGLKDGEHTIRVAGVKNGSLGPITTITQKTDTFSPTIINFSWCYNTRFFNEIELDWHLTESADVYLSINGKVRNIGNDSHYEFTFDYGKTYDIVLYAVDEFGNRSNTVSDSIQVLREADKVDSDWLGSILNFLNIGDFDKEVESYVQMKDCGDGPPPGPGPDEELEHEAFSPFDPNDFYGPAAYGKENWIAPQEMQFQIRCENIPEENIAHAAMVTIKHKLDDAYDYSTFRLGDMMIGGNYVEISEDVKSYKARLDWTSTLGVLVDVNAFFDADTGEVVWEFVAIDPETGWIVSDPFKGLLAPNYNPPEGDGWVYYYVEPKETTVTGTTATSQAEIIFDYNEPIMTPVLSYTFDADSPEGAVTAVAATASTRYLRVDWSGTDEGSGVACYNVFVSVDGGDWVLWQENISATSALFTVAEGEHRYAFFAQAIDNVGLAEALGEMMPAEAETTASGKVSSLSVENVQAVRAGDELTLSIAFSEQAVCADWAAALLVSTSAQNIDLSAGTFRYDETTHVLTWVGTVAGVPDGAQATVRLKDGAVTDAMGLPFGSSAPAYTAPVELPGVVGSTYAAPALVDYNGDGLLDVLVGEVAENGKGRIRIYLNEGSAEVASFASFIYASTAEDTPLELAATGCQGAIVRLADITGDGKDEMVVGLSDGTIRIFTAAEGGYWADSGELSCSVGGESGIVDAGTRAAIEFVDANGDGRTDMLVGTGDGNVLLYLNTSAEGAAAFDAGRYLHDAAGRIDVGSRATVATGDLDGDGLWDMLLGTADGTVLFYRNEGTTGTPLFGVAETVFAGDALLDMSSETNRVRIDTGDLNGDGIDDLVVGQSDGKVKLLYGTDGADLIGEVVVGSIPLPGVPQNVQMMVDGSALTISWDAVAVDEAADISYELSYLVSGAEAPTVVAVSGTETTLELPDGVYSVQVRALNHGKGGDWSTAQNVTVDTVAPEVPGGVSAEGGETQAVLSWVAVAEAASYELRYRKSGSEVWRTVSGTEASVTLESLDPAEYVWQVRAVDAAGNASEWSASSTFTVTGVLPDAEQHWANGLRFDASGAVTGGYYDVNKTGSGDSNLCWAAAVANMLAWWQEQGMTTTVVPDAPQGAETIYATFTQSWENSSGVDVYGLIWWLSGDSTSSGYDDYVDAHYRGDSTTGAYYEQFYTPQTIAQHTAQVQLAEVEADTLSSAWVDIYEASGMIALGVFRSVGSGGSLSGGHSLTLWGFETNLDTGRVQEIYVTDSDDNTTALETLAVEYDEQTGYYTVAQDGARLNGYVLGTYTYLKSFTGTDIVSPEVTVEAPVTEKLANGRIRVTFRWSCSEAAACVLTVDGQTYNVGSETSYTLELADGEHAYSITATDAAGNSGSATGSFAMDATAPAVVQGVQAITGESGVAVSWDAVEDAASYTLEYATKADFSDAKSVTGITGTSYALTDVPGTGTLYVRVAAADTAGNVSDWSASAQTGLDITAPVVTLNEPEVKKIADGRIEVTFSWTCSESAVYVLTVDGKEYSVRGATRYTLELADGEHVYSVKATDAAGLTGSAESSFAMDATAPAVVQGVQAITGESGVAVSWNVVEDAASYTLEYATKPDFSDAKSVTGITGASYALTALPGTGTLYVRVASVDSVGNTSAWSTVVESGLDITAPGAVQGLEVMAHGTSARLRWDAVSDESGIAGYRIEYAVDGDFTKAQSMQVNSTEATFYTLLAGAAYQWRVAAVDGAGNVGAWTVGEAFRTGAAEPEDDSTAESREIIMTVPSGGESHSTTRVNGWVGFDDPADYYCFTAKGEGAYAISLDAAVLGTQVYLSVGTLDDKGNFAAEKKLLVAPGSAAAALGGIALENGEKCYIRVESYDKGLGRYNGEYSLSVDAEVADSAWVTDNNSPDKATMLKPGGAADAALSGWVGMGDAVDYYCFELTKPAELSLVLGELDAAVKVKLLREERDGGVSQVMSRSVKASRGLDHTLSLTSGTYFVEVASYDNGAGRYNTTYALELEKEEANGETKRFTLASA